MKANKSIINNIESWFFISEHKDIEHITGEIYPFIRNLVDEKMIEDIADKHPSIVRIIYALIKSNEMYSNYPSLVEITYNKKHRERLKKMLNEGLKCEREAATSMFEKLMGKNK